MNQSVEKQGSHIHFWMCKFCLAKAKCCVEVGVLQEIYVLAFITSSSHLTWAHITLGYFLLTCTNTLVILPYPLTLTRSLIKLYIKVANSPTAISSFDALSFKSICLHGMAWIAKHIFRVPNQLASLWTRGLMAPSLVVQMLSGISCPKVRSSLLVWLQA